MRTKQKICQALHTKPNRSFRSTDKEIKATSTPSLLAIAIALSLGLAPAMAATIKVETGHCNLVQAIISANTGTAPVGSSCANGSSDINITDLIELSANQTFDYTTAYAVAADGNNALPSITSKITIAGNGSTISRSGANSMRLFHVASTGKLSLQEVHISGGIATGNGSARYGGAIYCQSGELTINNSTLNGNSSSFLGGAIFASNTNMSITNSTLSGNHGDKSGGAIAAYNTDMSITNSTLSGNHGDRDGGAINSSNTDMSITNSTLSGNTSGATGGAIYARSGDTTIINSTVSGNRGLGTGGIYSYESDVSLINSVIANNLRNSNLGSDCASYDRGEVSADSHNLIENDSCYTDALTGDPKLSPLQDNGGPTLTHAPLAGSPLINAGDAAVCAAAPISNLDQRGVPRLTDGHCDIGAVEMPDDGSFFVIPIPGGKAVIFGL